MNATYLVGTVREVHANDIEAGYYSLVLLSCGEKSAESHTFSKHGNLLDRIRLGACVLLDPFKKVFVSELTDCPNNARPTVILLGSIIYVKRRVPLHLRAIV